MTGSSAGRRLVLHADDFGMNQAVTDGIVHGFTHGLLTSASLLANAPDAARAIVQWRSLEDQRAQQRLPSGNTRAALHDAEYPFDLGIHLNLTQGRPLSKRYPSELLDHHGQFCGIGRLFRLLHCRNVRFEPALQAELAAQIERMCDHGLRPTHLNGHQYIELLPGLGDVISCLLRRYAVSSMRVAREPGLHRTTLLRGRWRAWGLGRIKRYYANRFLARTKRERLAHPDVYFGTAHAGQIDLSLVQLFLRTGRNCQLIEIGLHPGHNAPSRHLSADDAWHDPLAAQRPRELRLLTSEPLVTLLSKEGIELGRLNPDAMYRVRQECRLFEAPR